MIKIRDLVKSYSGKSGNIIAVDHLSLDINENEIFGLLGANGAGKTTTIHMLATLLKPTSGTATVNGYDIIDQPAKDRGRSDAPATSDEFAGRDKRELSVGISEAIALADETLSNNELTLEQLKKTACEIVDEWIGEARGRNLKR